VTTEARAWVLAAPPSALQELHPLVRAHARRRPVRVQPLAVDRPLEPARLAELLVGAEALLLVGNRRRSPRTMLPGPFAADPAGRPVPVGWLPDLGPDLGSFARAAARVAGRGRGRVGPVAVLGQWDPRYLHLAARMEVRLARCASRFRVLRWTAERLTRDDLVRGLRYGFGAAVYFGHGRPRGWAGYHGFRAHHLVEPGGEPVGALLSVTCLTASRRRTGLAFSEAVVLGGAAAGAVGAVTPVEHVENMRWMLGLADALAAGHTLLGPALLAAAPRPQRSAEPYRIVGDPLAQLVGASDAERRSAAVFAPASDIFL
jgi:Peptidase family C25